MFVAEIFESFHGEVNGHHQGRLVTFIRLSGCNLRCSYCDTKETWDDLYGECLNPAQILDKVHILGNKYVCITGGEPLFGNISELVDLMHILSEQDYRLSVETNGTISITPFARFVDSFVIDYKLHAKLPFLESNLINLRKTDIIKFVVENEDEALIAFKIKDTFDYKKETKCLFAFSPVVPSLQPKDLANLMIGCNLDNCILSIQIHKIVNFK